MAAPEFSIYCLVYHPFRVDFCILCDLKVKVLFFFLPCGYSIVSATCVEKNILSILKYLGITVENQLHMNVWGFGVCALFRSIDYVSELFSIYISLSSASL